MPVAGAASTGLPVVTGAVEDRTGGALPAVSVHLESSDDRQRFETATDAQGRYRLEVPAGRYDVVFSTPDFAPMRRTDVEVQPGTTVVVDAVLQLTLSAHVAVTARRTFGDVLRPEHPGETLIGTTDAASQGVVTPREIDSRPFMRAGDLAETVPGVIVTQHSGEGKANQFYLRGINLDHGTDFAATVAGVPVNMPTHAHGQGYLDLNFLIPELVSAVRFKKGPYFAEEGDFSTAGAMHVDYANVLEAPVIEVSGGGFGWARAVAAVSPGFARGHLLAAVEFNRNDGPWERGDGYRRGNAVLRYTRGDVRNGWSLTGMSYAAEWRSTDQVPQRGLRDGRIGRFGAVDLSNGGTTHRQSVAFDLQRSRPGSSTRATAYLVDYGLDLFSNFTYFLDEPINGDQVEQVDRRVVAGLTASHSRHTEWWGRAAAYRYGTQLRHDEVGTVGLYASRGGVRTRTIRDDGVVQTSAGMWADARVQWTNWLRTTAGLRTDGYRFGVDADIRENGGREIATLVSPKAGVVLGPWRKTEWYLNAGYGFHSNDARGTTIVVDPRSGEPATRATPLARARGTEFGVRTHIARGVQATAAVWTLSQDSELVFAGDAGTTVAGRPSVRRGIELSVDAAWTRWLMFDADVAWSRARFRDNDAAGRQIPGAVGRSVSVGLSTPRDRLLFGTLRLRHLGRRPLVENGSVRSRASTLVTGAVGVRLSRRLSLAIDAFNLFDAQVSDADYFYTSRLPGEPADGIADVHSHPALPRTIRIGFSLSY